MSVVFESNVQDVSDINVGDIYKMNGNEILKPNSQALAILVFKPE